MGLRQAGGFLPVSLGRFKAEPRVIVAESGVAVARVAAVADEDVFHENKQQEVDKRKGQQNAQRRRREVISPGDGAEDCSQCDQGQAHPLREVFLPPQIAATTNKAPLRNALNDLPLAQRAAPRARFAVNRPGIGGDICASCLLATGTMENDKHREKSERRMTKEIRNLNSE
jgi:hypothetical protein